MYNQHTRIAFAFSALTGITAACGGTTSESGDTSQAALTATTASATESTPSAECFTAFVTCVRDGGDEKTCHESLRTCVRPEREGGGGGHCQHDGAPPNGDTDGGARMPPPGGHPPPDGPHGGPPGGHGEGPGGGARPCIDALVSCAQSDTAAETCAADAVTCVTAARANDDAPTPAASESSSAPAVN